jgi:two-component system sensor histidine kinase PhoQ
MPPALAEPRLSLPGSGLYARITHPQRGQFWTSPSSVGRELPFEGSTATGQWRYQSLDLASGAFLGASYGVRWADRGSMTPLVFSVLEDRSAFDRELRVFERTLWLWLGGAGGLLLLAQTLLLQWGLSPLRRVAEEVRRIERGEQSQVEGRYPRELAALTDNLNTLMAQERIRQGRYKEALSFLAHSLKTPLAVLRTALADPAQLPDVVEQQVARMDGIVQHQLGRAAATGAARFAPRIALAPVLTRIGESLAKVYADKQLDFQVDCPAQLHWRIDEGDAFEIFGNVLDNAAKWARRRVRAQASANTQQLTVCIEDDGPGFTDVHTILQLHVRLDERVPGHGIGLTVVDELVASHGGQLKLSNRPEGGGRVEIVLPVA